MAPEYRGTREIPWEAGGTTLQGKTQISTDSAEYHEGKVKSTPGGE